MADKWDTYSTPKMEAVSWYFLQNYKAMQPRRMQPCKLKIHTFVQDDIVMVTK